MKYIVITQKNELFNMSNRTDDDFVGHHNAGRRAMYASNIQGRTIVNAITGITYPGWKVGSLDENRLWKVCDARMRNGSGEPQFYFYDSPEQAMKHRRVTYDQDVIDAWHYRVDRIVAEDHEQ